MLRFIMIAGFATLLAACNEPDVPIAAPQLTTPPDVATTGFLTAQVEETIPLSVPEVRAFLKRRPLIDFLKPTENISNPVETKVLAGTWPQAGATRWVRLADGHYVVERVIENRQDFFKYQLYVFTSATGRGVEQIVGEQRFLPVDGGTRFVWTYNVLPSNFITRQVVRGNMNEIEAYISGGLERFSAAASATGGA
ncbi:MAG: SRPBCC family protein [Pseudomonadota bacterium]